MCQGFVTRKWVELFIFQHLSSQTQEKTGGGNLKRRMYSSIVWFWMFRTKRLYAKEQRKGENICKSK